MIDPDVREFAKRIVEDADRYAAGVVCELIQNVRQLPENEPMRAGALWACELLLEAFNPK